MKLCLLLAATLVAVVVAQPKKDHESTEQPDDTWPGLRRGEPMPVKPDDRPHIPEGHGPDIHEELPEHMHPGEKPLVRCKRIMCRMFCKHGFQLDNMGCPTCHCAENPCQANKCEDGKTCVALDGLKHECVPNQPCAMPMCANHCPNGYKTDKLGCMECKCKESECEDHPCAAHHTCVEIPNPSCRPGQRCGSKPMCLPLGHEDNFHPYGEEPRPHDGIEALLKSGFPQPVGDVFDKLCLFRQKFADELAKQTKNQLANNSALNNILGSRVLHRPHCKENGDFHDMQCHFPDRQCWCVDDRGAVLKDSQKDVKRKEDLPECVPHKTTSLEGSFLINHELENVMEHMEHIKSVIHDHLSKWLLMDKEFIIITKIEAKNTKENVIIIEFSIHHDGKTDLTALERQLLWHFQQKHSSIPFHQTFLQPQVKSLKITHHAQPLLPEHGLWTHEKKENCFTRFYRHHKTATIAGGIVAGAVFILIVAAVIITVCKRRKMSAQFKHKRMTDKSEKYKQNLAYANELCGSKVDIKGGEIIKGADEENREIQA